jgi:hypothetical protein
MHGLEPGDAADRDGIRTVDTLSGWYRAILHAGTWGSLGKWNADASQINGISPQQTAASADRKRSLGVHESSRRDAVDLGISAHCVRIRCSCY